MKPIVKLLMSITMVEFEDLRYKIKYAIGQQSPSRLPIPLPPGQSSSPLDPMPGKLPANIFEQGIKHHPDVLITSRPAQEDDHKSNLGHSTPAIMVTEPTCTLLLDEQREDTCAMMELHSSIITECILHEYLFYEESQNIFLYSINDLEDLWDHYTTNLDSEIDEKRQKSKRWRMFSMMRQKYLQVQLGNMSKW